MASRQAHCLLAVASALLMALATSPAYAQDDGPSEETAARALAKVKNANDEFDRGEYNDALRIYQEAYELYPDPVLLYRIGLAAEKAGELRLAVESYEAFVEASNTDDATAKRVAKKLPDLQARLIPMVVVKSVPEGAEIFIDGLDDDPVGVTPAELELEPGDHEIIVRLEGYRVWRRPLSLETGDREEVEVELEELRKLASVEPDEEPEPVEGPEGVDSGADIETWGWISAGTGVALLGTGAVFSILTATATNDVNTYDKRAPGASEEELLDLKDRARSLYGTSIATYIAGGVFTTIGAVLLTIDFLADSDGAPAEQEAASIRLRAAPTPSGGWVGLSGRF